jgi:hypothetical protein
MKTMMKKMISLLLVLFLSTGLLTGAQASSTVSWEDALESVQGYLQKKVTNPSVDSTHGEWAVFAMNRGGAASENWNSTYIGNLKSYVDECNGILHEQQYTEYSRVILALTSMGMDASQFRTDTRVYDLVSPLLDKQSDGDYWANWQGNNGSCFALLALDSVGYLDNAAGRAARAGFIASLWTNRLTSGAWPISNPGTADLDVTAAVVYALAPYYLDSAKLTALGGSVTYSQVKTMVDGALTYLSGVQSSTGGFGSAEADGWVIIALSTLGRDADSDTAFVKNGHSLLEDFLGYYDASTGGFKHLMSGSVNQMASEQAAYDLAAYARYKNGNTKLFDMSDIFGFSIGNGAFIGTTSGRVTTFAAGTAANTPTVSVTAPASGWTLNGSTVNTFTVSSENDKACAVLVKHVDGSYTRLSAATSGSSHSYSTTLNSNDKIVVVMKGDADGDGTVTTTDAMLLARACLSSNHVAYKASNDINKAVYGTISTGIAMEIARACLSTGHLAYKPIEW